MKSYAVTRQAITLIVIGCLIGVFSVCAGSEEELAQPLTLQDVLRLALERNPSVATSASQLRSRQAGLDRQESRREPSLTAGWSWRTQKPLARTINVGGGVVESGGDRTTTRELVLTLQQTFFESGRREAIRAARESVEASDASYDDARRQLLLRAADAYHAVLANQELAEVGAEAVEVAEEHLEMVNEMIAAETVAPVDRLNVEAELADAEYEAVSTINAVRQSMEELKAVLALPPESAPELAEAPDVDYSPGDLGQWLDEAPANRPDLEAQQHQVRVAELNVRQAEIGAGLSYSLFGQADYGRYTNAEGETWSVGASVSYPLHSGQARAEVDQARADLEAARQRLEDLKLSVTRDVAQAWYALGNASERVVAGEASVAAATRNLEAARERYVAEVVDIIAVTDAELTWRRARGQLVQARYDRNVAYYQLLSAAGRLVDGVETPPAPGQGVMAAVAEVAAGSQQPDTDATGAPEQRGQGARQGIAEAGATPKRINDPLWNSPVVVIEP